MASQNDSAPYQPHDDNGGGFQRTWTEGVFGRTITRNFTEGWNKAFEDEDAWTRKLYEQSMEKQKAGVDGDMPAPEGFAHESAFWKLILISAIFGVIFGFVAIAFLLCAEKVPKEWVANSNFETYEEVTFYAGKHYYILVTGAAGLLVGILRYSLNYPASLKGLFKEIEEYHVEPTTAPSTVLLSAISLGGGASLGPEQALGNIGGGFATWLIENHIEFPDKTDGQMVVLCGMCAAFGALFPTPVLGVLLIYELGQPPKPFMESIVTLSVGAVLSFVIYYQFAEDFWLDKFNSRGMILAYQWEFNNEQCLYACIFGVISGALCLMAVIMIGIMRQVFNRIRERVNAHPRLSGTIIAPLIGGLVVGTVSWALPLTIGDGNMAFEAIIRLTFNQISYETGATDTQSGHMTAHLLICSLFAKMFSLAVCMNCGFVGGFVFPMITIGCMAGCVTALFYTNIPTGMCIGCFMAAVPAGICPMPFTLLGISVYCFFFGIYQTVPIYISVVASYTIVCGSGIFRKLALRGRANAAPAPEPAADKAAMIDAESGSVNSYVPPSVDDKFGTGSSLDGSVGNPMGDAFDSKAYTVSVYSKQRQPAGKGKSDIMMNLLDPKK